MFSVVIPLYNKELCIENTIQSVLDQTFRDFEIVVINDGSTDNSENKVSKFSDSRIRLIKQENQGVSAARNRGIIEAKHEWIAFLDGDDLWPPEKLEIFNKYIQDIPDLNWGFSGYALQENNVVIKEYLYEIEPPRVNNIFDCLLGGIKIITPSVIVRRSVLVENNFFFTPGLNRSEDREVWYKLCCFDKRPLYVNKCLSIYVIMTGQESLSSRGKILDPDFNFLSMEKRIEKDLDKLDKIDRSLFLKYLRKFNEKFMYTYWLRWKSLPRRFKNYLPRLEYFFLLLTAWMPYSSKKFLRRGIDFYKRKRAVLYSKSQAKWIL